MQKVILTTIIIILVGVLTLLAVFYFEDGKAGQVIKKITGDQVSLISKFSSNAVGSRKGIIRLSNDGVSTYGIVPDKKNVAFFDRNGVFKIVNFTGDFKFKGEGSFTDNIIGGVWAKAKMEAIVTTINSDGVQRTFYDYLNGKTKILSKNIQDISFSKDGERIVYGFFDEITYEGNISTSRTDGSSFIVLFKTRLSNMEINWPQNDLISFYKKTLNKSERVDLFKINNKGEELEKILTAKKSLRVTWAPDGKSFIYSVYDNDKNHLYYKFLESSDEQRLDVNTSADQCTWSRTNTNIICFVDSSFYKINVLDGSKDKIHNLGGDSDIKNLELNSSEDFLFFINNNDGQLYSLPLE